LRGENNYTGGSARSVRRPAQPNSINDNLSKNGGRSRNQRLPRRFGEFESSDDESDENNGYGDADNYSDGYGDSYGNGDSKDGSADYAVGGKVAGRDPSYKSSRKPSSYSAAFGVESKTLTDKKTEKKSQKKRLLKLVGNEALCLIIIFGMIAAFNWTATDFSGDYMGRNRQLGQIRLSLAKHGENLAGELDYGHHGFLNMVEGEDANKPQSGEPFTINFVETAQFHRQGFIPWRASFTGRIDGGKAIGTVTDRTGQYKVTMEKNVLTSLFRQTQDRIPQVPAVPLPSLFNEKDKGIRGVVGTDAANGSNNSYRNSNSNTEINNDAPFAASRRNQGAQGAQAIQGIQGMPGVQGISR
jgi:hypothetical protein